MLIQQLGFQKKHYLPLITSILEFLSS